RSSRRRSGSTATASTGRRSSTCSPPPWRISASAAAAPTGIPLRGAPAAGASERRPPHDANSKSMEDLMTNHKEVSREEWIEARKKLLAKEKDFTRARDALSQERRDLPWERVDKTYAFEGPNGKETLADLFAGRHQLIVQHLMFDPGWEAACKSCSF